MKQWNEIFKKHGKVFYKPEEDIARIAKYFKKHKIKGVLDLGCGTGRHIIYFVKKSFNVYGFDISEEGVKATKEWLRKEK